MAPASFTEPSGASTGQLDVGAAEGARIDALAAVVSPLDAFADASAVETTSAVAVTPMAKASRATAAEGTTPDWLPGLIQALISNFAQAIANRPPPGDDPGTTPGEPSEPSQPSQPSQPSPQMWSVPATGDTTAALQGILDQLQPGDTLTLDRRTYQHNGVLQIRVPGVHIVGNGATLQATNDASSSVQILADNVSVENLTLTAPPQGPRYEALEQQKLAIRGNGDTVTDVTVNGSAAAGVLIWGASNFTLTRVNVSNTRADGIHMSNGSNHGTLNNVVVTNSGDDGVAVVSYGNQAISHDIVINSPTVNGTSWGRGISVVGGQNIAYNDITVKNSNAAAVYIADEGNPWFTHSVNHVTVTGGTITGANTNAATGHGAVLVYSANGGQSVNDVTISGLTIASTTPSAPRNVGIVVEAGSVSGIVFKNIALQNSTLSPLRSNVSSYLATGWTLNGNPITV